MFYPGVRAVIPDGSIISSMLDPTLISQMNPLSDGSVVNNVALFWRTQEPSVRVNNTSLVDGDLWYNPSTKTYKAWNTTTSSWMSITDFNNVSLTGVPTAPTATTNTNNNQIATTSFVQTAIQNNGGGGANSTSNFTQPSIGSNVTVSMTNTSWLVPGSYIQFYDGADTGFYRVETINGSNSATLQNLGYSGSSNPSTTMNSGGRFVTTGMKGSDGAGSSSSTITSSFIQPSINGTVVVSVNNTSSLLQGSYYTIFDGVDTGHYLVTSINGSNSVTLQNVGGPNSSNTLILSILDILI